MDYGAAIRSEFENIDRELDLIELLLRKSNQNPLDDIEIRAAALSLSTIYNGIEKVITYAVKDQAIPLPSASNWHTALLELAEKRSLIDNTTRSNLLGFLAFRHFVRHAYSFEIDPEAIMEILEKSPELVRSFRSQIEEKYR
jgi:hypothetical protein